MHFLRPSLVLLAIGAVPVACHGPATEKTVDLGGGKSVIFAVPSGWEVAPGDVPAKVAGLGRSVKLTPKNGANAECNLTIFIPPDNRFADPAALKEVLVSSDDSLVGDSLEGKVNAREFKTAHGLGFSATFTDKSLVGRPAVRGDYKVAETVVLYLPQQVVVTSAILCDDVKGPEYAAMIALLRSLGARSASDNF